ncbi:permease [Sulfurihydrogenibium sp.]|uniref:permease n=1 Tax=Sulfurihydrogenibium sp. TaxID=2053621 RepID=UPI0026271259|nr:permease [Sulfurihydrogenibium sp.]
MFEVYENLADYIVYTTFGLQKGERLSETIHFIIYDTLKIFTLLIVIIFFISFIRSYFPLEKTRKILSKHKSIALPLAAFLGVLTPFCSCSAVPMFIGFVEAGIPLSAAFTFLVASPMVNEIALGLLFSLFGFKVAILYLVFGIIVATVSGYIIDKLNPRNLIEDYVFELKFGESQIQELSFKERLEFAYHNVKNILKKIWLYIIVAIGIGGFIHGYVPQDIVENISKNAGVFSVPLAVLIGIPLYSNAAGILPVIQALILKGVPIGTALAFMMATTALSFPEFMILKQIMKPKLIAIFASIVGISIIIVGYLLNFIL